jgi:uncharacterized coiled-coil protein SlyX
MEERINSIETRIAFYEKTIDELSIIVFEQAKEIGFLKQKIEQINEIVKSSGNEILKDMKDETPPPHY